MPCATCNDTVKFGLPKGSLEDATINLFARSGWKISMRNRNYFPEINDPAITARLCRPQEMPAYIAEGVLDAGLTGKDWIFENQADVIVVGLIGGVKVYGKFSSGDPDTSKTAASWFGACIFLIVAATILRSFFL